MADHEEIRMYTGVYTVHLERTTLDVGPIEWAEKWSYTFEAKDDRDALERAKNNERTVEFLLKPCSRGADLELLSEKRYLLVPGQEPHTWTREEFGLKRVNTLDRDCS